ncbi:hypothetical protein JOF56_003054 [Kibdelosporangium banguiense]|uniref:Uncharacterized protein n=1 Tax=Kibdelosporangium banguiense TaxID=1365924 RepID=A0ABS4TE91_9PSEU|nr:hypothetical protein [Kibdelosporangium banguiense]
MNLLPVKIFQTIAAFKRRHRHDWRATDVELGVYVATAGMYWFSVTLSCKCSETRVRSYLDSWVTLKLAQMGVRDEGYQPTALKLAYQMRDDIEGVTLDGGGAA